MQINGEWLAERFQLGTCLAAPVPAAHGWGDHNTLWKLRTSEGVWAIKQVARRLPNDTASPFAIEMAAHLAGIPSPRPVASADGNCYALLDGVPFRCHEWVDGQAKVNEDVSPVEARRMGERVSRLHGLSIPATPPAESVLFSNDEWRALASRGLERSAPWAELMKREASTLARIQRAAQAMSADDEAVGSHRDLGAHNVLFQASDLLLIDWDAAGPARPKTELAVVAMLWSQKRSNGYDAKRTVAFLRGYRQGGGEIESDDPARLIEWLDGLVWWMHENVEMALLQPSEHQDRLTEQLLVDTLNGPGTVAERQRFLAAAIADSGRGIRIDES